jgi:hypothetical protein
MKRIFDPFRAEMIVARRAWGHLGPEKVTELRRLVYPLELNSRGGSIFGTENGAMFELAVERYLAQIATCEPVMLLSAISGGYSLATIRES